MTDRFGDRDYELMREERDAAQDETVKMRAQLAGTMRLAAERAALLAAAEGERDALAKAERLRGEREDALLADAYACERDARNRADKAEAALAHVRERMVAAFGEGATEDCLVEERHTMEQLFHEEQARADAAEAALAEARGRADRLEKALEQFIINWGQRWHSLAEAAEGLLSAMEMQEKRETEEFHIPQETALFIWNEAKTAARAALALPYSPPGRPPGAT